MGHLKKSGQGEIKEFEQGFGMLLNSESEFGCGKVTSLETGGGGEEVGCRNSDFHRDVWVDHDYALPHCTSLVHITPPKVLCIKKQKPGC